MPDTRRDSVVNAVVCFLTAQVARLQRLLLKRAYSFGFRMIMSKCGFIRFGEAALHADRFCSERFMPAFNAFKYPSGVLKHYIDSEAPLHARRLQIRVDRAG